MRKKGIERDFDFYIDEYMYYCQSKRLRQKTLTSYEQTLRLFERWLREQEGMESPKMVREQTIRRYICELQERGSIVSKKKRPCELASHRGGRRGFMG